MEKIFIELSSHEGLANVSSKKVNPENFSMQSAPSEKRSSIYLILAFLVGLILGFLINSLFPGTSAATALSDKNSAPQASRSTTETSGNNDEQVLKEKVSDLENQLRTMKAQRDKDILNDRLTLLEKYPNFLGVQTLEAFNFGSDTTVSPNMVELLKITPTELAAVQQAINKAKAQTDALESQHVKITENSTDKTVFEIPFFPEGAAFKEALYQQISNILGDRRAAIFMKQASQGFQTDFSDFGNRQTTVTITKDQNGGYAINESYKDNTGGAGSSSGSFNGDIPPRYKNIISLAPNNH